MHGESTHCHNLKIQILLFYLKLKKKSSVIIIILQNYAYGLTRFHFWKEIKGWETKTTRADCHITNINTIMAVLVVNVTACVVT